MTHIRVIDFETTGLPPGASVCEAGFVDLIGEPPLIRDTWTTLVIPTTDMALEALATHHIRHEDATQYGRSWSQTHYRLTEDEPDFFAAHNADFEKDFFNPSGSQWLDTYKIALRLWPDSPKHTNQVLRYYLSVDVGVRADPPHRALPDAWVTAHILAEALKITTIPDLLAWSNEPPYLTKIGFGKHYGKKFSEVPHGYLQWMLGQDMDAGVMAAARRELGL